MVICRVRTQGSNRRHRCGIGQKPFEGQVSKWKISINSLVRELGISWEKRKSNVYIVVSSESRSPKSGDLSLWRVFGIRVSLIIGCLSIWERHVIRPWYVMRKAFPYTSTHGDHGSHAGTVGLPNPSIL